MRRHLATFTVLARAADRFARRGGARRGPVGGDPAPRGLLLRSSAPTRRASTRTRKAPSRPSTRSPALQHPLADRSLPSPERHGDVASEWRSRPTGRHIPSRSDRGSGSNDGSTLTASDVKALRQDRLPAGGGPQPAKIYYTAVAGIEAPDRAPGVQAHVPVGLAPQQPRFPVGRHLSKKYLDKDHELLQEQRRGARDRSSSRATPAGDVRGTSGTPITSSRTGRISTGTSSSSARRRPCAPRRSGPGAPTSSSATCPTPRWRRSKSTSATRSPSSRPLIRSRSASRSTTP